MTSTFTSYQIIARNLPASLQRTAAEPEVARDTAYYQANIGKVKSIDDLFNDQQLYSYAMKAYGLEDMTYAKAFMRQVVEGGADDPSSFANRLADPRYVAFARAFDFTKGAASASGSDPAVNADGSVTPAQTAVLDGTVSVPATTDFSGTNETSFTLTSRLDDSTTRSVSITLNAATLAGHVSDLAHVTPDEIVSAINAQITASGTDGLAGTAYARIGATGEIYFRTSGAQPPGVGAAIAAGGSVRTLELDNAPLSATTQSAVDIGFGTAIPPDAQAKTVTDAYLQQTLEDEAGQDDTGVRLALYFSRTAPTVTSAYGILGDAALSQVVNTVLGLPTSSGATSSDQLDQLAQEIGQKVDITSFQDPTKLNSFVERFAALWDAQNSNGSDSPVLALFSDGSSAASVDPLSVLYPSSASSA
ncbi:DUF1217 domain-containing protein [Methylobacterium sp. JK268]